MWHSLTLTIDEYVAWKRRKREHDEQWRHM
jgi:hypothetical protein